MRTKARSAAEKPEPHTLALLDLRKHERHDMDLSVLPGSQDDPLKALRESAKAYRAAKGRKGEGDGRRVGNCARTNSVVRPTRLGS